MDDSGQERDVIMDKIVEIGEEIARTMDELTDEAAAKLDEWLLG